MDSVTLFLLACGLAMDAFAVSLSNGLCYHNFRRSQAALSAVTFGIFQAIMPVIGYFAGRFFSEAISSVDHWIAFILLSLIGINMIRESRGEAESLDARFDFKAMLPLAVATSIDALAVGVTFAFLKVNIVPAVCFIGIVTFVLSCVGVFIGNRFGCKYKSKAEFAGGLVLIIMGIKILLEHTIMG